jgi:hypothetical protein
VDLSTGASHYERPMATNSNELLSALESVFLVESQSTHPMIKCRD